MKMAKEIKVGSGVVSAIIVLLSINQFAKKKKIGEDQCNG